MIIDADKKPTFAQYLVLEWLSLFHEIKNPIYAWRTYQTARNLHEPVPDEILRYLDKVAVGIVKIANNPLKAKDRPIAISQALGLAKKGAGALSIFNEYNDRRNARKIAMETFEALHRSSKEYVVFEQISEKYRISESTTRRIYKDHVEQWQREVERLTASGTIEFGQDGTVKMTMAAVGAADDLRETAIILDLIKDKLKEPRAKK